MSYSKSNPAWGRNKAQSHDDRIQEEARLAARIMETEPGWSRTEALRRAALILDGKSRALGGMGKRSRGEL